MKKIHSHQSRHQNHDIQKNNSNSKSKSKDKSKSKPDTRPQHKKNNSVTMSFTKWTRPHTKNASLNLSNMNRSFNLRTSSFNKEKKQQFNNDSYKYNVLELIEKENKQVRDRTRSIERKLKKYDDFVSKNEKFYEI